MKARYVALLLLLLLPLSAAIAQSTTLQPDTPLIVEMRDGRPVELTYESPGNDVITVSVRSLEDEMDTTLEILSPEGVSLAQNDDHDSDRMDLAPSDSQIADLALSAPGTYTIVVDTFSGVAQGSLEVLLVSSTTVQPSPEPTTSNPIPTGDETLNGSVAQGEVFTYDFAAETDELITFTVRGQNGFDPRIALLDSKLRVLAENDDHASGDNSLGQFDSRIAGFVMPSSGTYTLEISGYEQTGGDFTLELVRGAAPIVSSPITTLQGTVNNGEFYSYELNAQQGDVYTISARSLSEELDPLIAVYDGDNNLVAYNDDHGDPSADLARFDSRITRWIIGVGGRYIVEISGYQGGGGEFELTLELVAQNAPTGVPAETVYTLESNGSDVVTQTFEAQAGDWVSISARGLSNNFDPYVALLAPDGTTLAENTDHGLRSATLAFVDAYIASYPISEDGTYTVNLISEDGSSGTAAITISVLR